MGFVSGFAVPLLKPRVSLPLAMIRIAAILGITISLGLSCTIGPGSPPPSIDEESQVGASTQSPLVQPSTSCPRPMEVSVGEIDVDFYGGHSNISGPVSVKICDGQAGDLSASERERIRAEFESIVRERWLAVAFVCNPNVDLATDLLALRGESLKRLNQAAGRRVINDFACGLNFSESAPLVEKPAS